MSPELHLAITIGLGGLSLLLTAICTLLFFFYRSDRAAQAKRIEDLERRGEKAETQRDALMERLRVAELDVARIKERHDAHDDRLDRIESGVSRLEKKIDEALRGYARSDSPQPMPAQGRRSSP